jgi:hypothetical protein
VNACAQEGGKTKWGKKMISKRDRKAGLTEEKSELSEADIRRLLMICTDLVNLCTEATGGIDPAAAAMLAYVKDNIRFENKSRRV